MTMSRFSNVQRQVPRILNCSPGIRILLVTAALSSVWVPGAAAACGSSVQRLPPSVSSALQLPPLQEPASDGIAAEEPERGEGPSMTGLWKTVFVAGGAVVNLGFNTWHSDGTEWALDGGFPPAAGNVCPGVWERIGHRSYRTVHPAFNYDASNTHVASIFIERLNVTISRDGNSYQGDFTWDSYDFQGNLLPGSVVGRITGTRIQVGSAFPFPFSQ
jgi:hypothetical protein